MHINNVILERHTILATIFNFIFQVKEKLKAFRNLKSASHLPKETDLFASMKAM